MSDDAGDNRKRGSGGEEEPEVLLPTPDALALLEDEDITDHAISVLAELKDRGMLRVLLRNRTDLATLFEVEEVRFANGSVEVIPEGLHAETPEEYPFWVEESDELHERLSDPALDEEETDALLRDASSEALLLALERQQDETADDSVIKPFPLGAPSGPSGLDSAGPAARIANELRRRGALDEGPLPEA